MKIKAAHAGRQTDTKTICQRQQAVCPSVCLSVCGVIKSVVWFAAQRRRLAVIDTLPLTFIEQRHREEERVGGKA